MQGLLPHLRQFVRVRQALVRSDAVSVAVTDLLDNTHLGVIHLDPRGRIVETNDRARAVLRHRDGLMDRGGELRASQPEDQGRLARLVGAALPSFGAVPVGGSLLLQRPLGGLPVVVHVHPVVVPPPDYGARRVAALVLLVEPGRPVRLDPWVVATTLGVTQAESEVAVALAAGHSVRAIAQATGRQANTVRYQLKQVYHKLGLSGQADLVRVVLSLAGVPDAKR